jgi:hypothetical protein
LKECFVFIKTSDPDTPKVNVQTKVDDKIGNFIGMFEAEIDKNGWSVSMFDMLTKHQISSLHVSKIIEFYKPIVDEANMLVGGRMFKAKVDPQILEGYSNLTKDQVNQRAAFYNSIIDDCERYSNNNKVQRAPRKKKPISAEKKLKNFTYLKDSKEFKLVSVNPEKVLGSKEIWTFNSKYKILTHLVSLDRAGIDVKGTTFQNVDENESKSFRVARKAEASIKTVLNGGKREINKMIGDLKSCALQQRSNENTILLKVI